MGNEWELTDEEMRGLCCRRYGTSQRDLDLTKKSAQAQAKKLVEWLLEHNADVTKNYLVLEPIDYQAFKGV